MIIIGCDFHTRYQQIAMADDETGELLLERRLDHESGEAHAFYRNFSVTVRVGIEARWRVAHPLESGISKGAVIPDLLSPPDVLDIPDKSDNLIIRL